MKKKLALLVACMAAFIIGLLVGLCHSPRGDSERDKTYTLRTDSATINEEIRVADPTATDSKLLGHERATLPLSHTSVSSMFAYHTINKNLPHEAVSKPVPTAEDEEEATEENAETNEDGDNHQPPDLVEVEIPIEQRHYADTIAGYEAWVSGYNPRLDSLIFTRPHTYVNTYAQTEVTRYKTKRWGLSIGVGAVTNFKRIEPGVFLGLTYTFLHI